MAGRKIGYARTANSEGDIHQQVEALRQAGCADIHMDVAVAGDMLDRVGLRQAQAALGHGDILVVQSPDRLSRSVGIYAQLLAEFERNGVSLQLIRRSPA